MRAGWSIIQPVMFWPYVAALTIGAILAPSTEPVLYSVTLAKPGDATISVSLTLASAVAGPLTLVIPRAVPMGYSQQLYDRYVSDVAARGANGEVVPVERKEGSRWQIGSAAANVRQVSYRVDLAKMERELLSATDSSRARSGYAGILGYSVFGYFDGMEGRPLRLEVEVPQDWPVFTTLAPAAPAQRGRVTAEAPDFYTLADSQVAMGPALSVVRLDNRVPLYLAAYSEGAADLTFTGTLIAQAMSGLLEYFGSPPFAQVLGGAGAARTHLTRPWIWLQHGAPVQQPLLPDGRHRGHASVAGGAAAASALQLCPPHRPCLDSKACIWRRLLSFFVGARAGH